MYCTINTPGLPECGNCGLAFAYQEIELLYQIAVGLGTTADICGAIERGMKLLQQHAYLERCALFLANPEKTELELKVSINLTPQQKKIATYRFGEGATGLAAKSAEPVVIENIHNNINYLNKLGTVNSKAISYIAIPRNNFV